MSAASFVILLLLSATTAASLDFLLQENLFFQTSPANFMIQCLTIGITLISLNGLALTSGMYISSQSQYIVLIVTFVLFIGMNTNLFVALLPQQITQQV